MLSRFKKSRPRITVLSPDQRAVYGKQRQQQFEKAFPCWLAGLPHDIVVPPVGSPAHAAGGIPAIIAVGGGKGGVGKSFLSANLAACFGDLGFNVLLVDLDLGSANLHTYFGMPVPKRSWADAIVHQRCSFVDAIMTTPTPNTKLIASGRDEEWAESGGVKDRVVTQLCDQLFKINS